MDSMFLGRNHPKHASNLIINTNNCQKCLACMIDFCSDDSRPNIKKHYLVSDLIDAFTRNRGNILSKLQTSPAETQQMIETLMNLISHEDMHLSNLASEGVVLILSHVKNSESIDTVLSHISIQLSTKFNFPHYLPFVNLSTNLFIKFPHFVTDFMRECEKMLDDISRGLSYPNERVKEATVNFFSQISKSQSHLLNNDLKSSLLKELVKLLKEVANDNLLRNAMSLIKILIQEDEQFEELFRVDLEGGSFSLLLKKMLLRQEVELQIECCQTLFSILSHKNFDAKKADLVMQCEVSGILFEILATQNINLIESVFNCIRLFCNYSNFYDSCHVIFGIDPIFRCIDQLFESNSVAVLPLTMIVLKDIFSKNQKVITLFGNNPSVHKAISVLRVGINSNYRKVSLEATRAFQYFLKKEYMKLPIPFRDIINVLEDSSRNMSDLLVLSELSMKKGRTGVISNDVEFPEEFLIAKLGVIDAAIRLLQDCISDPSCFEESFKPPQEKSEDNKDEEPNSCTVTEFVSVVQDILNEMFSRVIHQYSSVFKDSQTLTTFLRCLINLDEIASKIMQEYFVSLCKMDFLIWLWQLKQRHWIETGRDEKEVLIACNQLLKSILTNLTYNFEETEGLIPIFEFDNLNGSLGDCATNILGCFSSFWADNNRLLISHSSILAIIYFVKLHSNSNCLDLKRLNFLEILVHFIQSCPNLHIMPHYTHKHLLFLFACSYEESSQSDLQKSRIIQPVFTIFSCLAEKYFIPLKVLYTHCHLLLKWIFSVLQLANIFGRPFITEWFKHVEKSNEEVQRSELSKFTSLLMNENDFIMSAFLDLINSVEFSVGMWVMLCDMISDMDTELQLKTRSAVLKKFCDVCGDIQGRKVDDVTENVLLKLLQLLAPVNASDTELLYLKVLQNVCNTLPEISRAELIEMEYYYLNYFLTTSCAKRENKVLILILSRQTLMEHVQRTCLEEGNIQHLALNLMAELTRYQFTFKTQVQFCFKLEFAQLEKMFSSEHIDVVKSAVLLLESLVETSFKSSVVCIESLSNEDSPFDRLRLLYIHLQNTAFKVESVFKVVVVKCIIRLLKFAQKCNPDLGTHLMSQQWIGILFDAHIKLLVQSRNLEFRQLLYLFLEFPVINSAVLEFIIKLLNSFECMEKGLAEELFAKLSRSFYFESVKPKIEECLKSKAMEE